MNKDLLNQLADVRAEILVLQRRLLDLYQHVEHIQGELLDEQINSNEMLMQDLVKREPGLIINTYPHEVIETFILDRRQLPHLRCIAIEDYLPSGNDTSVLVDQLSHDPLPEVRICLIKVVGEHNLSIPESLWMQFMSEPNYDIMLNATRAAVKQVGAANLHPRVLTAVREQSYFLVKDMAVRAIIDSVVPDEEKLALLTEFTSASYFKTRRAILDYFASLGTTNLRSSPFRSAIEQLLGNYLQDPRLSTKLESLVHSILRPLQDTAT